MSRPQPARFDQVMQADDVSKLSARDTEPLSAQDDDEPEWVWWLGSTFSLVLLGLIAVVGTEFSTRPDHDGIEHQFDPTWGERFGVFFETIAIPFLLAFIAGALLAVGWIGWRTWRLCGAVRQRESRHAQPPTEPFRTDAMKGRGLRSP
jgi:hypothetical protein